MANVYIYTYTINVQSLARASREVVLGGRCWHPRSVGCTPLTKPTSATGLWEDHKIDVLDCVQIYIYTYCVCDVYNGMCSGT